MVKRICQRAYGGNGVFKIKTTGEIVSADDITASGYNLNGSSNSGDESV